MIMITDGKKDEALVASSSHSLVAQTATIVTSYLGNTAVSVSDVPALIETVHRALANASTEATQVEEKPTPAVPIRKSITPDYIVCLEDGKQVRMLKRYIKTHFNLTPEEYRRRWGLSDDYPMTAPNYSKRRSELAKAIGLGRPPEVEPVKKKPTARRSKKSNAE
jgi:predicted transcriptional regulator